MSNRPCVAGPVARFNPFAATGRATVTQKIIAAKKHGLRLADVARPMGLRKEYATVAQAAVAKETFGLDDEETARLRIVPYKGSQPTAVPTAPLIYRW